MREQSAGSSSASALPHPDGMTVVLKQGYTVPRRSMTFLDNMGPELNYSAYTNNIRTLERGVLERVFYVKEAGGYVRTPTCAFTENGLAYDMEYKLTKHYGFFLPFTRRLLKALPFAKPITQCSFIEKCVPRKKVVYEQAARSLQLEGVTKRDAVVGSFVKYEKSAKDDPAARIISPRDPRYNLTIGVYLKPYEKRLFRGINKVFGSTTICKGLNASDCGNLISRKWNKFKRPVAIGLDASRFDQHVGIMMLKLEHHIYNTVFNNDPLLANCLTWQLVNKAKGYCKDGTIKYEVNGTRMSGDMNTSMGNCLIMTCMIWMYMHKFMPSHQYELINNGDDCSLIMEHQSELKFSESTFRRFFTDCGFEMTIEPTVYELEHIVFCQTQPVAVPGGYRMVRDPRVSIMKDCVSLVPITSAKTYGQWLWSIGSCGLALTNGIPIWQHFHSLLRRSAGTRTCLKHNLAQDSGAFRLAEGMPESPEVVADITRASFFIAFDITPEEQRAIERYYVDKYLIYGYTDTAHFTTPWW